MEPVTLALGIGGLAASIFGGIMGASASKQAAQVSEDEARQEQQENVVKNEMAQMQGRRAQTETLRTAQRARAQSINTGYSQTGSITGTGVQGGIDEDQSKGYYGLQGINQNLQFSNTLFGINSNINADKEQLAQIGSEASTAQGITSIGGALMNVSGTVGKFSQGFGSTGSFGIGNLFMGGGSPSGYGR